MTSDKSSRTMSGVSVAKDFNNTLNSTLAFEAMRLTANYARIAQAELASSDYKELMAAVQDAGKLLPKAFNPATNQWPSEAEEINLRMEEKLKDYEDLAGGFKKFVENAHAAGIAAAKHQP